MATDISTNSESTSEILFQERSSDPLDIMPNNLIINYLPPHMKREELRSLFAAYGRVLSAKVVYGQDGISLCYGFVKFASSENAKRAVLGLDGLRIHSKRLKVSFAYVHKNYNEHNFCNLIVKNLPKFVTCEQLVSMFYLYGRIVSACVLYHPYVYHPTLGVMMQSNELMPRLSKGIGFVRFYDNISAIRAQSAVNGSIPIGFGFPLEVKFSIKVNTPKSSNNNAPLQPALSNGRGANIFIRNLHAKVNEAHVFKLFESYGLINCIKVIRGGRGNSKGYGFVEMASLRDGLKAIADLHGSVYMARVLIVKLNVRDAVNN